jgi:hypothetical protein
MADVFLFADNARSTLAAPIGPSATTITLAPGTGALFPSPGAGQQFALSLNDASTHLSYEIVYCTHRSTDTLTVIRAQEGTSALSWLTGDLCWNGPTSGQMAGMVQIPHMTDASIAPVFAGTEVVGNLSVTGNSQVNDVSFFGTSGVFYANPAFAGGPAIAFATNEYLQWNGSLFSLISSGGLSVSAGNIVAATGKLRANVGAYLSGDANCATLLGDFLNASVGSSEYFYARDPDGVIVQAYWGTSPTGTDDVIAFPNAFPNFCCQVVVCEGAPSGWGAGGDAPTILGATVTGPTSFALYTDAWDPGAKTWGGSAGITYRYIAVGY